MDIQVGVIVKPACNVMPDMWFAVRRTAIVKQAQSMFENHRREYFVHECTSPKSNLWTGTFDRVSTAYKACASTPTQLQIVKLSIPFQCTNAKRSCEVYCYGLMMLTAMHQETRLGTPESRMLFETTMPIDMFVQEVYARLDIRSRRALRVADPRVRAATSVPAYSHPWKRLLNSNFEYHEKSMVLHITAEALENAYAGRLEWATEAWFSKSTGNNVVSKRLVLAAAMGGTHRFKDWIKKLHFDRSGAIVFHPSGLLIHEAELRLRHDCAVLALSAGHMEQACDMIFIKPFSKELYAFIASYAIAGRFCLNSERGFEHIYDHPLREWLKARRYAWFDWYFTIYLETEVSDLGACAQPSWSYESCQRCPDTMRQLLYACAAHGNVRWVEMFSSMWYHDVILHIVQQGTSAAALEWFSVHEPAFFGHYLSSKKSKAMPPLVAQAIQKGEPEVLTWLLEKGYFRLEAHAPHLKQQATQHKHTRALAWLDEKMQTQ